MNNLVFKLTKLLFVCLLFCNNKIVFAGPCLSRMKLPKLADRLDDLKIMKGIVSAMLHNADRSPEQIAAECTKLVNARFGKKHTKILEFLLNPTAYSLSLAKEEILTLTTRQQAQQALSDETSQYISDMISVVDAEINANAMLAETETWGSGQFGKVQNYLLRLANNNQSILDNSDDVKKFYSFYSQSYHHDGNCPRASALLFRAIKDIKRLNRVFSKAKMAERAHVAKAERLLHLIAGAAVAQRP